MMNNVTMKILNYTVLWI